MGLVPARVRHEPLISIWTSTKRAADWPAVFLRWLRARDFINADYFRSRPFSAPVAYLLVFGLYVGSGFATGTVNAVQYLISGGINPEAFGIEDVYGNVAWILMAVSVWVMVTHLFLHPRRLRPRHAFQHRDALLVVSLDALVSLMCFLLMAGIAALIGSGGKYPAMSDPSPEYLAGFFTSLAAAGFCEEIFLLALPVLLLRSARRGWGEIVLVLAVVRISFHIYYGLPVVGLIPWAVLAVLFFRYTQSVWPLVLAHSLLNLAQGAARFGGDVGTLMWVMWVLLLLGVFGWLVTRETPVRAELGLPESPLTKPRPRLRKGFAVRR